MKLLASNFIRKGFGFPTGKEIVLKKFNYQLNANSYNNYMTTVVRFTFRQLQDFIVKQCNRTIKPITHPEQRIIRSPMIQCRKWMTQRLLQKFFKFIKRTFKVEDVTISNNQANEVYNQLMELIKKVPQKKNILKTKKHEIQTQRIQKSLNKAVVKGENEQIDTKVKQDDKDDGNNIRFLLRNIQQTHIESQIKRKDQLQRLRINYNNRTSKHHSELQSVKQQSVKYQNQSKQRNLYLTHLQSHDE